MNVKKGFSMRMDADIFERLSQIARERHMTKTQVVTQLILNAPVERPEEIGQVHIEDLAKGRD